MRKAVDIIISGRILAVCLLACICVQLPAKDRIAKDRVSNDTVSVSVRHYAGLDYSPVYVFPTHDFFKGTNAAQKPVRSGMSVHLKYGFSFGKDTWYGRMYPHARQGLGVAYNTFLNKNEIGDPVAIYVFQTSCMASLAENLSLDYEWNFGASFGWKPFDETSNPFNKVVGSQVNAYIHLGLLLNWNFATDWQLRAGVGLTHFSNGNTNYPNAGVNTVGARIGVTREFGNMPRRPSKPFRNAESKGKFRPHVTYDLILYGSTRKKGFVWEDGSASIVPGVFAIAGLNFNPMYNFNQYFRAGLSLDAQFDESANIKDHIANDYIQPDNLKFHRPPFWEQFAAGISVRAEIVMPVFSINLGIGRNLLCKGADTDSFYQTFVLKADIAKGIFLHIGYQVYRFKEPNNLMLGIGYRFNNRRRQAR